MSFVSELNAWIEKAGTFESIRLWILSVFAPDKGDEKRSLYTVLILWAQKARWQDVQAIVTRCIRFMIPEDANDNSNANWTAPCILAMWTMFEHTNCCFFFFLQFQTNNNNNTAFNVLLKMASHSLSGSSFKVELKASLASYKRISRISTFNASRWTKGSAEVPYKQ